LGALAAKTRYRQADAACTFQPAVQVSATGAESNKAGSSTGSNAGRSMSSADKTDSKDQRFQLQFTDAQWAVTPGQSAVLYAGDECLGGGIIESVVRSG
jgi:tRNA-specific 2-thiouridylase